MRVMSTDPSYLRTAQDGAVRNLRDWGIPLGRRFRALKLWFLIREYGVEGLQARIRRDIGNAAWLAEQVDAAPGWERLAPVPLQTVCVRHVPPALAGDEPALAAHNLAIADRINRGGRSYLTPSRAQGQADDPRLHRRPGHRARARRGAVARAARGGRRRAERLRPSAHDCAPVDSSRTGKATPRPRRESGQAIGVLRPPDSRGTPERGRLADDRDELREQRLRPARANLGPPPRRRADTKAVTADEAEDGGRRRSRRRPTPQRPTEPAARPDTVVVHKHGRLRSILVGFLVLLTLPDARRHRRHHLDALHGAQHQRLHEARGTGGQGSGRRSRR